VGFVVIGRGGGRPAGAVLGAFSGGFWGAIVGESRDRWTTIHDGHRTFSTTGGNLAPDLDSHRKAAALTKSFR
jgi:uncharacterized protein YcfJ